MIRPSKHHRLPDYIVREIKEKIERRVTLKAELHKLTNESLAEEYGVKAECISDIATGKRHKDI